MTAGSASRRRSLDSLDSLDAAERAEASREGKPGREESEEGAEALWEGGWGWGLMQMKSVRLKSVRPRPGGETLRYRTYSHERSTHINVW